MKSFQLLVVLALLGAASASAQGKSKLITEASYSVRLAGGPDGVNSFGGPSRFHLGAAIGTVKPVSSKFGVGAVATVGVWDDFYFAAGPRFRFHASPTVAVDVTPQLVIKRGDNTAGRGLLDLAVMYKDQIGMSVQLASFNQYSYGSFDENGFLPSTVESKPALFAGFRLGGKPGRYGMLADGVALVSLISLLIIVCSNNGCD